MLGGYGGDVILRQLGCGVVVYGGIGNFVGLLFGGEAVVYAGEGR